MTFEGGYNLGPAKITLSKEESEALLDCVDLYGPEQYVVMPDKLILLYQQDVSAETVGKEAILYLKDKITGIDIISISNKRYNEILRQYKTKSYLVFGCFGFGKEVTIVD